MHSELTNRHHVVPGVFIAENSQLAYVSFESWPYVTALPNASSAALVHHLVLGVFLGVNQSLAPLHAIGRLFAVAPLSAAVLMKDHHAILGVIPAVNVHLAALHGKRGLSVIVPRPHRLRLRPTMPSKCAVLEVHGSLATRYDIYEPGATAVVPTELIDVFRRKIPDDIS